MADLRCSSQSLTFNSEETSQTRNCITSHRLVSNASSARARPLVVFLQGALRNSVERSAVDDTVNQLARHLNAPTVVLTLPGNREDPALSDLPAGFPEVRHTPDNAASVAHTLDLLRFENGGRKILLVGYASGAAMAAMVAGNFPASADGFLLVACPCRTENAPASRSEISGSKLLPLDQKAARKENLRISVVVGTRDDKVLPKLSESYVAGLRAQGIKTRVTYAAGATHISVLRSPEFFMHLEDLAARLSP